MLYTNSPFGKKDFAINFFYNHAAGAKTAQLACPFFTYTLPLKILSDAGCQKIQLLIRLCSATSPIAIAEVAKLGNVQIRFFTGKSFHAKFYLVGPIALIGSANLTDAGMQSNREIALSLPSSDGRFDELPMLFDELWQAASVLTDDALNRFSSWHRIAAQTRVDERIDGIEPSSPPNINVESQVRSAERTYLESFRQEYYETLIPNHRLVQTIYWETGRHRDFVGSLPAYEIDRFMSWAKLTFTTDETVSTFPIRHGEDLRQNIKSFVKQWFQTTQVPDPQRLDRLANLKTIFESNTTLDAVNYDNLMDALLGCAAFDEQLRFTKGGRPELIKEFRNDNSLQAVQRSFGYLAFGPDEFVRRIYDCIYSRPFKLQHFGRTSVFELFGWISREDVPPMNGRSIKALRFLGFDARV